MIGTFKAKLSCLSFTPERRGMLLVEIDQDNTTAVKQIIDSINTDNDYRITVDKPDKKKTPDQNAYLWVMCDRIAQRIKSTKEEVYREFIRRVGVFDIICIQNKAVERYISNWQNKGIGWVCDITDSKLKGCTNVMCYYGTSCYTREELSRLLDEVVSEAKSLNIPTEAGGYDWDKEDK